MDAMILITTGALESNPFLNLFSMLVPPHCWEPLDETKSTKHIPHLYRDGHGAARPNIAQARLLDQLTAGIVVGNPRGDAHPTATRTLGPGSSLNHALISHLSPS